MCPAQGRWPRREDRAPGRKEDFPHRVGVWGGLLVAEQEEETAGAPVAASASLSSCSLATSLCPTPPRPSATGTVSLRTQSCDQALAPLPTQACVTPVPHAI